MRFTPYVYLGDKQTATGSDLAQTIMNLIDELALTDEDYAKAKAVLDDHEIAYE